MNGGVHNDISDHIAIPKNGKCKCLADSCSYAVSGNLLSECEFPSKQLIVTYYVAKRVMIIYFTVDYIEKVIGMSND